MKRIIFLTLLLSAGQSLLATIVDAGFNVFKETQVYGKNSPIGLEIINKNKAPFWFALQNGPDVYSRLGKTAFKLEGESFLERSEIQYNLDIDEPTFLAVWNNDPGKVELKKTGAFGLMGAKAFFPQPDELYTFTPGRTVYLTRTAKGDFKPETGPLKGLLGKTDSGLSLKNNVQEKDIKKLPVSSK